MMRRATSSAISRGCTRGSLRMAMNSRSSECKPMVSHRTVNLFDSSKRNKIRNFSSQDNTQPASYQCVHVFISVKPGTEQEFLTASLANARASSQEPGIARFDVLQQDDDPTKFVLVEVYKTSDAPAAHKSTNHYLTWRDAVEHMMAEPRRAIKYKNQFPATVGGWDYGEGISLE
ncbi:hypothetical protein ACHAWU_006448 [Discostella pseudostelligera]|uniref:ABM domain-containing protein n=1 Tax=Discostella pseudostelligera TaxID=259834 RepID=A0ABD3N7S5_9STRA